MRRRWAEWVAAVMLLTRLPVRLGGAFPAPGSCVWAYPLVGVLVGTTGAAVLAGALALGLPQPVAAICAVGATVLLTGGLHEDGLADTADGFGGGRTREQKLAIMRDSRIGSFGALALFFSLALRVVPLALAARPGWALLAAAVFGRGAMLVPLLLLRPARTDGLGASLGHARWCAAAGLGGLALAGLLAPLAACAAVAVGLGGAWLARRQVGGHTGDVLGAVEQAAECAVFIVAA